ncbi:hypothetical protein NE865_01682 [Phthorimaea operculella]|nr:hypothetical protein NE865_01682 [Phthorimaea operculella]
MPNSPRLLPRRSREPPPPPPRPMAHSSRLDPLEYELELGAVNWQERCLELQLELHRSRHQATRVRDMLRDKVRFFFIKFIIVALSKTLDQCLATEMAVWFASFRSWREQSRAWDN